MRGGAVAVRRGLAAIDATSAQQQDEDDERDWNSQEPKRRIGIGYLLLN
jgi:hypothetical protein